jgi:hypothetical protein
VRDDPPEVCAPDVGAAKDPGVVPETTWASGQRKVALNGYWSAAG